MNHVGMLISLMLFICGPLPRLAVAEELSPFSLKEVRSAARSAQVAELKVVKSTDGTKLAYRAYTPAIVQAVLVLYHGAGAHSAMSYQHLGSGLSTSFPIAVITPDMRGHGFSGGKRGDTPSTEQMYDDISVILRLAEAQFPNTPLFLGGHSAGAGLVLNYSSYRNKRPVSGYVFVAPYLGFRAKLSRANNPNPFAKADVSLFVEYATNGTHGHSKAVFYNYPQATRKRYPQVVTAITVLMANAQTPTAPAPQLRTLDAPLAVWIGTQDEVINSQKLAGYIILHNPNIIMRQLTDTKHLSILLSVASQIGPWIVGQP